MNREIENKRTALKNGRKSGSISEDDQNATNLTILSLEEEVRELKMLSVGDGTEAFKALKKDFDGRTKLLKKLADEAGTKLSNVFKFCESVFGEGQEMLILVTELTISYYGAHFISRYGCKEYFEHNKELLFYERQKEIISQLEDLELS